MDLPITFTAGEVYPLFRVIVLNFLTLLQFHVGDDENPPSIQDNQRRDLKLLKLQHLHLWPWAKPCGFLEFFLELNI